MICLQTSRPVARAIPKSQILPSGASNSIPAAPASFRAAAPAAPRAIAAAANAFASPSAPPFFTSHQPVKKLLLTSALENR